MASNETLSKSQYGRTSETPPTLYVPRDCDPMIRVYEKLVKIREREEKFKKMEKPKKVEVQKREETTPPLSIVVEDEKPSLLRKSLVDIKSKWHIPHKRDEDEKPFRVVRKELRKDTKEQIKNIWYSHIGKTLEDDSIEKEWKLMIGEIQLESEPPPPEEPDDPLARSKYEEYIKSNIILHKPLTRRELVELRQAQKRALDMKFVDIYKKEPLKQARNQNIIKNLQKRKKEKSVSFNKKIPKPEISELKIESDIGRLSAILSEEDIPKRKESSIEEEEAEIEESEIQEEIESKKETESEDSDTTWPSCSKTEVAENELFDILPFLLERSVDPEEELLEEEELKGNIWKYLEELVPKDSEDSLEYLFERRPKESSISSNQEPDTYKDFKRRRKKKAENERRKTEIQEAFYKRLEKLDKLKDPVYLRKLMEETLQSESEFDLDEKIDDYDFEQFLDTIGENEEGQEEERIEEEEFYIEEEEIPVQIIIEEHKEEEELPEEEPEEKKPEKEEVSEISETKESESDLDVEKDIRKLSDTKTESTISKEEVEEEQEESKEISIPILSPKARYFDPKYPELFASDTSIYPSYTNLKRPYALVCADRIKSRIEMYKRLFRNELLSLQRRHPFAFGGVQIARQFIIGIRVPRRFSDPMNPKERTRVENLLKY